MTISISSTNPNQILLETKGGSVLFDHEKPVAVKVGSCLMASNSHYFGVISASSKIIIPQNEIEYIIRTI